MKVGEIIEVEVERLDANGSGVAQVGDRELLIPGVFPSERASVRVEALARHSTRAHGRLRALTVQGREILGLARDALALALADTETRLQALDEFLVRLLQEQLLKQGE
jgi:predicted RNA-binding protein with TRAM domain